ncbi:MAG: LysR substrate-binding domain-containing protein, partial [Acidimicrobiales bacterium]
DDWLAWLQAHGADRVDGTKGLALSDGPLAIQAALNGLGVALGRSRLVEQELADERLVRPFDLETPADFAYYAVCPRDRAKEPSIRAFRAFLLAEAEQGPGEIG